MDKLLERFLNYVSLDTQSKAGVRQVPSTEGQWKLLHLLKEQLEEMGYNLQGADAQAEGEENP